MNAKTQRQGRAPLPTWQFEDVTLTAVIESEEPLLSPFELYPDCTPEDIDKNVCWLTPDFYSQDLRLLVISIQSFLIRADNKTILIDTCSGNCKRRQRPFFNERRWDWLSKLRRAGVAPEDVNIVACSHCHVDHVGWNTCLENGRWVPTFPNARYLFARREWEFWRSAPGAASLARTGDFISDSVLPIIDAGKADLIDDHFQISEHVNIEPAHGHTPGHFLVRISCSDHRAVLTGDLMHTPLQLRYPEWSTRFCVNPALARETRLSFLKAHCDTETLIFPSHFPSPTGGRIRRDHHHYRFEFAFEAVSNFVGAQA